MENKYWACIFIVGLILTGVITSLISIHITQSKQVIQVYPVCQTCPIYEDCRERIDYCFEKCEDIICLMVVGGCEGVYESCMWNCFHPNYGVVKIN